MQQWKPKADKVYSLHKILENGTREFKGIGEMYMEVVQVGYGVAFANWYTTPVDFIEKTGKGIIFETRNSTYILEEFERLEFV